MSFRKPNLQWHKSFGENWATYVHLQSQSESSPRCFKSKCRIQIIILFGEYSGGRHVAEARFPQNHDVHTIRCYRPLAGYAYQGLENNENTNCPTAGTLMTITHKVRHYIDDNYTVDIYFYWKKRYEIYKILLYQCHVKYSSINNYDNDIKYNYLNLMYLCDIWFRFLHYHRIFYPLYY